MNDTESKPLTREELLAKATHYVEHRYTIMVNSMAEADKITKNIVAAGFCTASYVCYKSEYPKVSVTFLHSRQVKDWEKEESAMLRDVVEKLADIPTSDNVNLIDDIYNLVVEANAVVNRLKGLPGWHEGSLNG